MAFDNNMTVCTAKSTSNNQQNICSGQGKDIS